MSSRAFCHSLRLLPVAATLVLISTPAAAGPLPVAAENALARAAVSHVLQVASSSLGYKITVSNKDGKVSSTSSAVTKGQKTLTGTVTLSKRALPPGIAKTKPKVSGADANAFAKKYYTPASARPRK